MVDDWWCLQLGWPLLLLYTWRMLLLSFDCSSSIINLQKRLKPGFSDDVSVLLFYDYYRHEIEQLFLLSCCSTPSDNTYDWYCLYEYLVFKFHILLSLNIRMAKSISDSFHVEFDHHQRAFHRFLLCSGHVNQRAS